MTLVRTESGVLVHPQGLCDSTNVGAGTRVWAFAHVLAGAVVGRNCNICGCAFVEGGVVLGDRVIVKNGTLVCEGVTVEDEVLLGPNVLFTNGLRPRVGKDKSPLPTTVRRGVTLGAGAVVICGIDVGEYAFVAAGAVIACDVPAHAFMVGNPARRRGWACRCGERLDKNLDCHACGDRYRPGPDGVGLCRHSVASQPEDSVRPR